jgi:hypothetical protein
LIESRTTRQFWRLFQDLPDGVQRDAQRAYRLFRANPAQSWSPVQAVDEAYIEPDPGNLALCAGEFIATSKNGS